ncbi:MAG: hypothetical protein DRQ61_04900 [Gammaproteobacteria bacterium]|nr:MAG: hypothetical protein DRQ61_04900 [Gammaproteobacteria bacterium]
MLMKAARLLLLTFIAPTLVHADIEMVPMVVVANKSARPIADVVGSVVSISADDIDRNMAENFDDLLRYYPSLNIESTGNRFQSSSINIRGIGGNRVAIEVDGIPSTDHFDVGAFSNSARVLPEIDLISHVEILNGPASTLYGSDAIGGVVAVRTWNPDELVSHTEGNDYYKLRIGYDGKNSGQVVSGMAAWQGERFGGLLSLTHRHSEEMNNGDFADIQDELDADSNSIFAKATYLITNGDKITLTAQSAHHTLDSENNALASAGIFKHNTQIMGDDSVDTTRLSLEYQFSSTNALFKENLFRMYHLDSKTEQDTASFKTSRGRAVRQDRYFEYQQKVTGLEFNSHGQVGNHNVVMGFEYSQTQTEELRKLQQTDLITGGITPGLLSEASPLRDFPISKTEEVGLFVQDEIALNSSWKLVPALRFDYYHLKPRKDAIYVSSHPQSEVVSITETAWSPKLGLLHKFNDTVTGYAQYVRGFRAPPFEDANISMDFPLFKIRAIPNPDLQSETSDGFELGFRQIHAESRIEAAVFYTHYNDFIETKVNLGKDATGTTLFQSQNLHKAEIYGLELSYQTDLENWNKHLSSMDIDLKLSATEGNNLETDQPINSISPPQATVNIGWHSPDYKWQVNLVSILTAAKTRVDETKADLYKTPGYAAFDLLVNYQMTRDSEIHFGLFNLTNKEYLRWQDVRNLNPANSIIQSVTQPQRSVSLSFTTTW